MPNPRIRPMEALLLAALACWGAGTSRASDDFSENEIVVGLAYGVSIDSINPRYQTHTRDWIPGTGHYLLGTVPGTDLQVLESRMSRDSDIAYAEKNHTTETAEGIQKTTASVDRAATTEEFHYQPYRVAHGIHYAVQQGARVIHLSLAVRRQSSLIGREIRSAIDRGVTVTAAVGDQGMNAVDYPASETRVIATAAVLC